MMASSPNDSPLQELKHEPVPGYLKAFVIASTVMGIYLAVILISSPGSAKNYDKSSGAAESASGGDH